MSLPDNVTADTSYTVRCTNETQGFSDITVTTSATYGGCLKLQQDADTVLIDRADVPGLIAALQGLAPEDPAYVIDNDGERWNRVAAGLYTCADHEDCLSLELHARQPLAAIRERYGIRETA